MPLSEADQQRLEQMVGIASTSVHDGEALNALRFAQQLAAAAGYSLLEALRSAAQAQLDLERLAALEADAYERGLAAGLERAGAKPQSAEGRHWRDTANTLLSHHQRALKTRDVEFLELDPQPRSPALTKTKPLADGPRNSLRGATVAVTDLALTISWFLTGMPRGPAIGDPERTTWENFCGVVSSYRRENDKKDGVNFIAARFQPEPDGKHVRRLGRNLIARTAIALDIEANKKTGEDPPDFAEAVARVRQSGWAGIAYTSHSHSLFNTRYRLVLPLSEEIDPELPAVELIAGHLLLHGVFDQSKRGASSIFYLPSCPPGLLYLHEVAVIDGAPIDADWVRCVAGEMLAERKAEQDRIAAEARAQAEARRQAKIAAGHAPDDSLIAKIRDRLDLEHLLLSHGYDKRGDKFRHPNSTSGSYGADIKVFAGIERVYSHNANDPLHRDSLPIWCGGVTALDAVDVAIILDHGSNRSAGLRGLAERCGLTRTREWKAIAALLFRLIRERVPQEKIEAAAYAEGTRQGLTPWEVCEVSRWVAAHYANRKAA